MCCRDTVDHTRRILITDAEGLDVSSNLGLEIDDFSYPVPDTFPYTREVKKIAKRCYFLSEKECSIYDRRPLVCIFYPFGLEVKNGNIEFKLTGEPCQGLGQGRILGKEFYKSLYEVAQAKLRLPPRFLFLSTE